MFDFFSKIDQAGKMTFVGIRYYTCNNCDSSIAVTTPAGADILLFARVGDLEDKITTLTVSTAPSPDCANINIDITPTESWFTWNFDPNANSVTLTVLKTRINAEIG